MLLIDGWGWREPGDNGEPPEVNGLVARCGGLRESGKSTLMKSLAIRLPGMQAGLDDSRYPLTFRERITDQRFEGEAGEYTDLTEALRSKVIHPMELGGINCLDSAMGDELSLLETAINLSETVRGRQLTGYQPLAHQVAMHKMYNTERRAVAGPNLYERILRGLTIEDAWEYDRTRDESLKKRLEWRAGDNPGLLKQLNLDFNATSVISKENFESDAGEMAASFSQLLHGDYGSLFGDKISLSNLLGQEVTTVYQSGMSIKMRNVFDALMGKWMVWAMENNRPDMIPHLNIGDEAQDSYKSLMWLRFYDDYVRKARSYHMWDIRSTQFEGRLRTIGPAGSEQRELAETIDLGVSMRFIGKQPKDADILESLTDMGFSDEDAWFTTNLPQGCFALKLPDRPAVFFQHIVTEVESRLIKTNRSNERMMNRANVWSFEEIRRRALEMGTEEVREGEA
jgi:hypothetical protein